MCSRPDLGVVCAVGPEKLDVAQPIGSSAKDRIRIRKTESGRLGFGSGDCGKEENIVALSRTSSARSHRSTIDVQDRPPEIESDHGDEFRSNGIRLVFLAESYLMDVFVLVDIATS